MQRRQSVGRTSAGAVGSAALVALGLAIGASSVAVADATEDAEIRACVRGASGTVRIVGNADQCRTGEQPLSWNQRGPSGLLDIQHIRAFEELDSDSLTRNHVSVSADCPDGYRVLGGGVAKITVFGQTQWLIANSGPRSPGQGTRTQYGWGGSFETLDRQDADDGTYLFSARAICALTSD